MEPLRPGISSCCRNSPLSPASRLRKVSLLRNRLKKPAHAAGIDPGPISRCPTDRKLSLAYKGPILVPFRLPSSRSRESMRSHKFQSAVCEFLHHDPDQPWSINTSPSLQLVCLFFYFYSFIFDIYFLEFFNMFWILVLYHMGIC